MSGADVVPNVELTEQAARRVLALLSTEPPGSVLRVGVEGGGCSGFEYRYAIEPGPAEGDVTIERDGARVVVDSASLAYLGGARIDYVDNLLGQAFRIENPNAASSCGCGASFSV
jgi:iron-sulfur cluster assembly accessory protein